MQKSPLYYYFRNLDYVESRDERGERALMNAEDLLDGYLMHQPREEEGVDDLLRWFQKPLAIMTKISGGKYEGDRHLFAEAEDAGFAGLGLRNTGIREPISLVPRAKHNRNGLGFRPSQKRNRKRKEGKNGKIGFLLGKKEEEDRTLLLSRLHF